MVELIDFINQEKVFKKINSKKIINIFNKCIIKSILELDIKFNSINNKHKSIIACINMIYNVFIILILYSNNIKLTIFLVERSILLYSEFIIMSQDKKMINEICFLPNITDALSFSYKKTIGPLKLNGLNKSNKNIIKEITFIMKNIFIKLYEGGDDINKYNNIENSLFNLFNILNPSYYDFTIKYIINIIDEKIDNIELIINSMICFLKNKPMDKFKDTFTRLYFNKININNYIDYINQIE
jgi:hypothetical protein